MSECVRWLILEAPRAATIAEVLHGFVCRLNEAGFDCLRLNLQVRPLSPQVAAAVFAWTPSERGPKLSTLARVVDSTREQFDGGLVTVTSLGHGAFQSEAFRVSPFFPIIIGGTGEVRRPLTPDQTTFEFPILGDLHELGATDYLARPISFHETALGAISVATRRPGGFSEAQLELFRSALPALSLSLSPRVVSYAMHALLGAYLGPKTAERVLAGQVQRGDVEEIDAVVWFSDLRGFTPMTAGASPRDLIAWLNEYFAAVARGIGKHDGEILKFIGDAILAVWPVAGARSPEATCRAALAAARDANAELDSLNQARSLRGLPLLQHGIGLHIGPVQYGNIGAEQRLDFTVIGSAVNMASRLEGATGKLGARVIASAEFAAEAKGALTRIGEVELKGVPGTQAVFGLTESS
ncbi:MAG TPA: adenylate/guanylate cyclase domain-containing protein [Polyangiaceae bacterium]|nr:adenylate/guanylate cyclase domain-containing protein [Polyangiaceae bacterium]